MINKKIILGVFAVFLILLSILSISAYVQSRYSSNYNNAMGIGVFSGAQSLRANEEMCQQGTDFIMQIGPLSCTPAVVRSDLLEEEDVRVFCQLSATQINPFVDVEAIKWIQFTNEHPKEVLGIGYQPARAALGYAVKEDLEGSAILENLGYVVITLRQQPNESALTNCEKTVLGTEVCWVEGNLTARLTYDVQNSFGVGNAVFYLPVMDDEEWEDNYVQYSFWEGRGYLRAESVDEDSASLSIYSDNSVAKSLSKRDRQYSLAEYTSNINLKKGDSSERIFLPGISPCLAGLELTLNGIENPDTRAVLKINEDYVEVAEGEKFLDNKCKVSKMEKNGINSEVYIKCSGADESSERRPFDLRIFPKVNLSINGEEDVYSVGDWLYKTEDGEKSVYLGYIGTLRNTEEIENLYAYLVALPEHKERLTDSEISSVVSHAESIRASAGSGAKFFDSFSNVLKDISGTLMQVGKWAIRGESFYFVPYAGSAKEVGGNSVLINGFSGLDEEGFITMTTTEYDLTTTDNIFYYFEDEGEKSEIYLVKSQGGNPSFSMKFDEESSLLKKGATIDLGTFYGEDNCASHDVCLSYGLSVNSLNPSSQKLFFGGIVSAEIIPEENKLIINRISFGDSEDEEGYQSYYEKAMSDFETIVNSFPKEVENSNSKTFGERALYEEIILASAVGQKKTMLELCKNFEEDYPNSYRSLEICRDDMKASNSEISIKEITINGVTKRISFERIKEPSVKDYGAKVIVQGPNGKTKTLDLRKDKQVYLTGLRDNEDEERLQGLEYIMLDSLEEGTASIKLNVKQKVFEKQFLSDTKTLKKGVSEGPFGGYTFTVTEINLNKVAKVSVNSRTDLARSNSSFKFKIGIEKRAIQLSPTKAQNKIDYLNESIAKWQKASDALYTTVKTMKTACLGAGAVLTFKNFIENYGGKSIARQEVMSGAGGWNEKCKSMEQYKSIDACFLDNAEKIEADVDELYGLMKNQEERIKILENKNMQGGEGLAQKYVNTAAFMNDYSEQVRNTLNSLDETEKSELAIEDINTILTSKGWEDNQYTIEQLKEIELYALSLKSSENKDVAKTRLTSVLSDVTSNAKEYVERSNFLDKYGLEQDQGGFISSNINIKKVTFTELKTYKDVKNNFANPDISIFPFSAFNNYGIKDEEYIYFVNDISNNKKYLLVLTDSYVVDRTFEINEKSGSLSTLTLISTSVNPLNLAFEKYDRMSYENEYKSSYGNTKDVLLKYYETSPYKGLPAVVPFDTKNGWYAGIKSPQTSYDLSGVIKSFWLCNVGKNGIEEFSLEGFGDDICQLFNLDSGQKYTQFPGLDEDESYRWVVKGNNAIQEAQRAYKESGMGPSVSINGKRIKVGEPAVQTPATQCTDFMSAKDCNLLFNLCDPVICPSSRCNLGGNYPVQNVVQSGIIGSIALCYPNAKWNGGDVYIPVCLTGIQAGIDSWLSIQKSYRDCLQTSINTGETVGICDEINSIYVCEFFWKQAIPIINSALPKLLGIITGQNTKGGGEYQGITSALETAENSIDYFKQYYAEDSYRAFKVRSTEEVGTELCSSFISATYPDGGSFLDNLIEPDSPFQFTGKFDENQLTTATNPPTSHYKVYYHIYAGKDSSVYYKVYLRGSGSSYYRDTAQSRVVGTGYIPKGEYTSNTTDFTAPSGYKELCIVVNGQEECGFKEVTTSFAVNYVENMYLAQQASETDIKTEKECISGSASLYNLLNLNVQEAAENAIDPAIYSQGIIRICSTDDPGVGTDMGNAGTESAKWKKVGYCGDNKIGCWIDTESVEKVIKVMNIEEKALDEVGKEYAQYLSEDYLTPETFTSKIKEIEAEPSDAKRIELISDILNKVFFNNQKAQLFFMRGISYGNLATLKYAVILEEKKKAEEIAKAEAEKPKTPIEEEMALSEFNLNYDSPWFLLNDKRFLTLDDKCFRYYKTKWQFSTDCEANKNNPNFPWYNVEELGKSYTNPVSDAHERIIVSLQSKHGDYAGGLAVLIDAILLDKKGELSDESKELTIMDKDRLFEVKFKEVSYEPMKVLYYKYENDNWFWKTDDKFIDGEIWRDSSNLAPGFNDEQRAILSVLKEADLYEGATILFDYSSDEIRKRYNDEIGGVITLSLEESFAHRNQEKLTELMKTLSTTVFQSNFKCYCGANCEDYAKWIMEACEEKYVYVSGKPNIPDELLLLAIMIQESSCKNSPESPSGDLGLMQINTIHCGTKGLSSDKDSCKNVLLADKEKNIKIGAQILKDNYRSSSRTFDCAKIPQIYSGWEAALRGYNGWGCTGNNNYVENVTTKYFELVDLYNGRYSSGGSTEEEEEIPEEEEEEEEPIIQVEEEIFLVKKTLGVVNKLFDFSVPTKILFKYDEGWKWTIYSDYSGWMPATTTIIAEGKYKDKSVINSCEDIIESLENQNYEEGKKILKEEGATMEDGSEIKVTSSGSIPSPDSSEIICTSEQIKCEGTTYYTCKDNAWVNRGKVEGKCGYKITSSTPSTSDCDYEKIQEPCTSSSDIELSKFSENERKLFLEIEECDECGTGLLNLCDKEECKAIALTLEKNCVYTDYIFGGICEEDFGSALIEAAYDGDLNKVKTLIESGVDIESKDNWGQEATSLIWASHKNHFDVVEYLIEKGANIEAIDYIKYTSLLWATDSATLVTVKSLVEKGANIEAKDDDGYTPLLIAAYLGKIDIVKYLVEKGANINIKDNEGKTALDLAEEEGHADVVNYLKSKGAISGTSLTPPTTSNTVRENILNVLEESNGAIVSGECNSDCATAVNCLYEEASTGLASPCFYSAKAGKEYNILTSSGTAKTIVGTQKNENGEIIWITANSCKYDSEDLSYSEVLKTLLPGDRIDVVYDEDDPHALIFVNWIKGQEYKIANVNDWNGNKLWASSGDKDSLGNSCTKDNFYWAGSYCKTYRYTTYDLSINKHPVYRIWRPVSA